MNINDFKDQVALIKADISREIELAKSGKNAGNFLCALALVEYTKFAGYVYSQQNRTLYESLFGCNYFNAGFTHLTKTDYKLYNPTTIENMMISTLVYANSNYKVNIAMLDNDLFKDTNSAICMKDNVLYFCVERYFNDLIILFDILEKSI